jgi:Scramblase
MTEVFTEANAFEITFPKNATADQKGMLTGSALFLNTNFFENSS